MKRLSSLAYAGAALFVARTAFAQTTGPLWGRPEVTDSPETEGPVPQGRNSVKLFDQYRSIVSYQLDIGPIWARRATETTPVTRLRNFERLAPLASEISLGTVHTTNAFKGPFFIAAQTMTSFRAVDDKSFSWVLVAEKIGGGISLGPVDLEAKFRIDLLSVDVFHAQPSVQMLTPGIEAGVGFHLARIRLDIKGHSEYLWRWFGPDYYVRGISVGLRLDAVRPKNPFPGAPPLQ